MNNSFKNTLNSMRTQVSATESKRLTHTPSVTILYTFYRCSVEKMPKIINKLIDATKPYLFFQKYNQKEVHEKV